MNIKLIAIIVILHSITLKAQGVLPDAIAKKVPLDYSIASIISSDDEKSAKGVVVFSIPQNNNCFGGDSAYITLSYEYFSKKNIPTADNVNKKKAAFDKDTKDNHKLTLKHIPEGLLNTHDKEFLSCTELFNGNNTKSYFYYYSVKYKCKGFAKNAANDIYSQELNEYNYTDIYFTARADEAVHKKDVTVIFYGTFTYEEAHYHTSRLLDFFLTYDYENIFKENN